MRTDWSRWDGIPNADAPADPLELTDHEFKVLKRVADLKRQMNEKAREQTAWLIECRHATSWLVWYAGGWSWTKDACAATKFADKQSADGVISDPRLRNQLPPDIFVSEHSWPDGF